MSIYDWFLNSNIYEESGKYSIFYSDKKRGPIYPEITAYAISLACILYKQKNDKKFLQRAKECADYLISSNKNGLMGPEDNFEYTFDTGILISGLLDLYGTSEEGKYADEASKRLEWLCSLFDGETFPAVVGDYSGDNKWDKVSSVHLAKLSIPLIKGWKTLGNENYRQITERLLDWATELQSDEGRFRINHQNDNTMLHPHCYATEGFLFASQHINKKRYWDITKKAGDWLAEVQNEDGSFYRWFPKHPSETLAGKVFRKFCRAKCTDATAQAIRIWKVLGMHEENIKLAEKFLEKMISDSGLPLVKRKLWLIELKQRKVFSWPTFFYAHAKIMELGNYSRANEIF